MGNALCAGRVQEAPGLPTQLPIKPHYRKAFSRGSMQSSSSSSSSGGVAHTADTPQLHPDLVDTSGHEVVMCNAPSGERRS
ncbi:MAG: hypothetical protein WDW36_002138 [Sanguina aurantia]